MDLHTAFPDLLGRHDHPAAPWEVQTGTMGPGMAWTQIGERRMSIPHGDTDNERVVRAHEMMHAKVSPKPEDMIRWLARRKASPEALTAAEELRVNTLISRAGFDVDVLTDGSETASGSFLAEHDRWQDAVMSTCAFAGTGRFRAFLVGVRRHNPEWAKTLRALHDRLVKELAKVPNEQLASTAVDTKSGLAPLGYSWTEAVAMLIDHAATPPEPPADDLQQEPLELPDGDDDGPEPPPVTADEVKKMTLRPDTGFWDDARWATTTRNRRAPGGIGTTKRASGTGRAPTRMGRALTDPHKRVFDRKQRGRGGVVLIDGSASMRFTKDDIKAILEAAPGCTVAMYCGNAETREAGEPNMWLLADKGLMVPEIPERVRGNSVDLPAAQWAVAARRRKDTPVVWVTDGFCHGPGQRFSPVMAVECVKVAVTGGVVVRPTVASAVEALRQIGAGRRVERSYPVVWANAWRDVYGKQLPGRHVRTRNLPL